MADKKNSTNPVEELVKAYSEGKLDKYEYIDKMHKYNKALTHIASRIKKTDIQKIEILDDLLIFTTRDKSIKMAFRGVDRRGVPFDLINFGTYESEDEAVLEFLIKRSNVILDVGANLGWYSALFSKINPSASIFSFEPIEETYKYLVANMILNQSGNVQTYNLGLKDKVGTAEYYYFPEGSVLASEKNVIESSKAKPLVCKVDTIDHFVATQSLSKPIDLIKCDVEGAEKMVIEGGGDIISKDLPVIFLELFARWTEKFGYHPDDLIKLLAGSGYKCYMFLDNVLQEFLSYRELENERLNFFFLHPKRHEEVLNTFS